MENSKGKSFKKTFDFILYKYINILDYDRKRISYYESLS